LAASEGGDAQNFEHFIDDDFDAPVPDFDRSDMPNTREPSPEPLHNVDYCGWSQEYFAEQFQAVGREISKDRSVEPLLHQPSTSRQPDQTLRLARPDHSMGNMVNMVNMVGMVNVVNIAPMSNGGLRCFPVQPMPIPTQTPPGAPTPSKDLSLTQPVPAVSDAMPTTLAPEPKAQGAGAHSTSLAQLAEQLEAAASKAACLAAERDALATQLRAAEARCTGSSTHGSSRREGKDPTGDRNSKQLSADRTAAVCRGVYEHMLQRGMTSADGYLVVDVLHEVRGLLDGAREGKKTVEDAFCTALRSAPEHFRIFRMNLQLSQCSSYRRKGERMVRLILD
jgi:hypothetical protein